VVRAAADDATLPDATSTWRIEWRSQASNIRHVQERRICRNDFTYLGSSDRGSCKRNTTTAHCCFDMMPPASAKTLIVRVNTRKTGPYQNASWPSGRLTDRGRQHDRSEGRRTVVACQSKRQPARISGRDTTYEIPCKQPRRRTNNVRSTCSFPPRAIIRRTRKAPALFLSNRQGVVFEPIVTLAPQDSHFSACSPGQSAGRIQRRCASRRQRRDEDAVNAT